MQSFRSELKSEVGNYSRIEINSKIFLIGSCFSDNIGEKFSCSAIETISNPLGITYNPASIARHLQRIAHCKNFKEKDLIRKGEFFNSFELHGSFDHLSSNDFLNDVNEKISRSHDFLKKVSHVFITLGTAWVYRLQDDTQIVNNCHKLPSSTFDKELLNLEKCTDFCDQMIQSIRSINSGAEIIFTVSPVRHLKDGFNENSLSKSILRIAIENTLSRGVSYFPAYEIVMDDLRDYRFYERDLLHPNALAVDYIWDKLKQSMMTKDTIGKLDRIEKVKRSLLHRSLNPGSESDKKFLNGLKKQIRELSKEFPELDFSGDLEKIENKLSE